MRNAPSSSEATGSAAHVESGGCARVTPPAGDESAGIPHPSHPAPLSPRFALPRVGIVGAGQLARMTVQASIPLGVPVTVLANAPDESAALVCPSVQVGPPASLRALAELAAACDVITFDHELVDAALLRRLENDGHCLRPSAYTMSVAQDKLRQRLTFDGLGLPLPPWQHVEQTGEVCDFARTHGWPVVLKARRGGYDGRGVWVVHDAEHAAAVLHAAQARGLYLIAEPWLRVERELAVVVARQPSGGAVTYPVVETVQRDGICQELIVPARIPAALAAEARDVAQRIAAALDASGIFALELFVVDGRIVLNEIAARPHNSGHFSLGGCVTSQFENHLRGVLDWPLGATDLLAPYVVTVNVLPTSGSVTITRGLPHALETERVQVHLYGKEPRPGRKVGHVTAFGDDPEETRARAWQAANQLTRMTNDA